MAKGKHATALFEVMNKSRFPGGKGQSGPSEGGFPTPKWWFKSRGGNDVKVIAPDEPVVPAPVVEIAPPPPPVVVEEPPAPRQGLRLTPLASSVDIPEISPPAPSGRLQPVVVSVDPDRQQINLRLSYTSALIGGFGVFIALGMAVLIGKGLSRGPSPAIANTSTQQLRKGPVTPGVLNVQKRSGNSAVSDPGEDPTVRATTASTGTRVQPSFNDPRPPATFFADDAHRSTGLNYAIIQSYPEKAPADKAAEFFTKNGVPCTVEKDLPGYKVAWKDGGYIVVGIRGFARMSDNRPLEAYKKSIVDVSSKYTSGRSKFSPLMYLWRKSN